MNGTNDLEKTNANAVLAYQLAVLNKKKVEPWNLDWWREQGFQTIQISEKDFMGWMVATSVIATAQHDNMCSILGNPFVPDHIFLELPPGGKYYEIRR